MINSVRINRELGEELSDSKLKQGLGCRYRGNTCKVTQGQTSMQTQQATLHTYWTLVVKATKVSNSENIPHRNKGAAAVASMQLGWG